jgi:protein tyrosine/serine phosphatase
MRRKTLLLPALLILPVSTAVVTKLDLVDATANALLYPRRFAEVELGALYRGGYPSARHVRNLAADKGIRTIVSLTGKVDDEDEKAMLAAARDLRLRTLRFPMPGNGCVEDLGVLDEAADAIHNAANRPVFFHCAAGKQRSNAVLAAYRMRHCGWTLAETFAELETQYDLEADGKEKVLVEHLQNYAKHLGLTARPRSAPAAD